MSKLGRFLIVLLLTAVAASSVTDVARAATVMLGMTRADDTSMDMDCCIACESGSMRADGAPCDMMVCAPCLAATIPDRLGFMAPSAVKHPLVLSVTAVGRAAPPDLLPPRARTLL